MKRKRIRVIGKVQGVFFRLYTKKKAIELGLTGWVQNEPTGTVLIIAEGPEAKLEELVSWCNQGSPWAKVISVEAKDEEYTGREKDFEVRK